MKKKYKSELLSHLNERGFIHQTSNDESIDDYFNGNVIGYIGFDMTAGSLHVGSLLQIMLLKWLQEFNHKPIILLGGGTTLIGDPSGKDETRKILKANDVLDNEKGILRVFSKFLDMRDSKITVANNIEWLKDLNYISFLRDYGKHFTINRMLTFDSVKIRLEREQPLSFLEFNYMLFQAYDFLELHKRYNCKLQLGGSDQWGNIINGIELIRRTTQTEGFAITTPLVTTSSGNKMGKTADGTIWLDENLTHPDNFWQYWRNTSDKDVINFLKLFTKIPIDEIKKLEKLEGKDLNEAKKLLANEITKMTYGQEIADVSLKAAIETFEKKITSEALQKRYINKKDNLNGIGILKLLVTVGFCQSNSEARQNILNNAIRIDDQIVEDPKTIIQIDNISQIKLSFGKKKHILVYFK